jgi:diguanylate cyclase (GGDEF)-like protein/PAS domain S-box-containing protein
MEFPFLLSTRLYPEWPIAKLMKTPSDLATKIAVALMSMDRSDPAAIASESGGWTYPMNYQIVHDLMMELNLGYYGKLRHSTLIDLLKKYWLEFLTALLVFLITSGALLSVLRLNRRLATTKKKLDIELAEREKIRAEIQRSEEQHRLLIERLSLAVFVHTQGKIVYANPAFLTLFKASSPDEVIGMRLIEFVSTEFLDTVEERRQLMTEEKRILPPLELNIRCMDGTIITVVSTPMPIIFQEQSAILTAFYDITERKRSELELQRAHELLQSHVREIEDLQAKLKEQTIRDPLTGLFNRRYLEETLGRELARALREGFPIGMVMIDIDHFKQVNDTHGHKAGDLILQALGNLLLGGIRAGDIACRYGGEEFLLILPQASKAITTERAEQWRTGFEALRTVYGEKSLQATISLGVAVYPVDGVTSEAVIHAADQAMYRAKTSGRNRVVLS